jgi:RNA polymerase sigma-70 factor (ECF subfamily)
MGLDAILPAVMITAGARVPAADAGDVAAARGGDREAFDRLVQRYEREVYRLCYRYVNAHHDASDLAQEAFIKAWKALPSFRGDSAFSTWLYRITVNTCLTFRTASRPRTEEITDRLPDARPGAAAGVERDERARIVREAVSRLPDKQRATLILRMYHELSHQEIAEIMGSTVGTVKANLFHALANLRRLLPDGMAAESGEWAR